MRRSLEALIICSFLLVALFGSSSGVNALTDWTTEWDTTSDWQEGTYENACVQYGSVEVGHYPPEPHFDGNRWYFSTEEYTEVDALVAEYKNEQAYFYARDDSGFWSGETGSASATAEDYFYLDNGGVDNETLEFWWKAFSRNFNEGNGYTRLSIQLQRPGESSWTTLWENTKKIPWEGTEVRTETVEIPASLLENSGWYGVRIYVYWYFDLTGRYHTEEFAWYVDDISIGFDRAQHLTEWRDMGTTCAWKTLEADAYIPTIYYPLENVTGPVGDYITARVEVSDDKVSVKDYEEIDLKSTWENPKTYQITDLEEARYVRVRTTLGDYSAYYWAHPQLNEYEITADPIPTLSSGSVNPANGTPDTTFTYTVEYIDPDSDEPDYMSVHIDNVEHSMTKVGGTYCRGATYQYTTTLGLGSHSYYFEASDGTTSARLPASGSYTGPLVAPLLGDANGDGEVKMGDAMWVAKQAVGLDPDPFYPEAADVDGNGEVMMGDAMFIAKWCVGLSVPYPIGDPITRPGDVWLSPLTLTVPVGRSYSDEIHVNTGNQRLGAFCLKISYDSRKIMPTAGAVTEPDDWTIMINFDNDWIGQFIVGGFTAAAPLQGSAVTLLTLNWKCVGPGTTVLDLTVTELTDYDTGGVVGTPNGISGERTQV